MATGVVAMTVGLVSAFSFKSNAQVETGGASYSCKVSSDPRNNTGHCRRLISGNGDMCFTNGEGPACSSTIQH